MKVICVLETEEEKDENFFEILYDERLAEGALWIPKSIFREVGGLNFRLRAKRQYELLLRLAERYPLKIIQDETALKERAISGCPEGADCEENQEFLEEYILLKESEETSRWEEIRTDGYIISRYRDKLLAYQRLNEVVESFLLTAEEYGLKEKAAMFLEKMLRLEKEYYDIDDAVRPVLMYKGVDVCYNILNIFAEQFGAALERMGAQVEYFDPENEDLRLMAERAARRYRAVIGWQSYMFSITVGKQKMYLHDTICAPAFNFIFDHPIWGKSILTKSPQTVSVLTHDPYYVDFCRKYYKKHAYLLPPAGDLPRTEESRKKYTLRTFQYDISFVGTYEDYREDLIRMHQMDRETRFLANRFLLALRKNPGQTADETFRQTLHERRGVCTDEEYLEAFFQCRRMIFCAMHYHRVKVIETLLKAGYKVDVFGDSWSKCVLKKYPNLICHPSQNVEECRKVWRQSKISLNIMSWHRGGFTERMANIMLCNTVLVTDDTTYLKGRFEHGRDLLIFHIDDMEQLPVMLKEYLNSPEKCRTIAENGFEKTRKYHTWDKRAEVFLREILEEEICSRK